MASRPTPFLDRLDRAAGTPLARAGVLAVGVLAVYLQAHFFFLAESHEVDSYSYWFAAEAVAHGRDPYDTAALQAAGRAHELRLVRSDSRAPDIYPYVYPPPFAGLWRATLVLSPIVTHRLLEALGAVLLGVAVWLLHRLVAPRRHGGLLFALFALGLAVNGPAVSSTRLGQLNTPLLVAMLVATDAWRRRADLRSAAVLAAAMLVKLSPAMLLLGWGLGEPGRRWWRYAGLFAAAVATLVVVTLPLAPVVQWSHFAAALRSGIPWQTTYSWWGWLTVHGERAPWLLEWRAPLYLAAVASLSGCAFVLLRHTPREDRATEGAAVGMVFMLLLSPLTWQHHFLFFMLPAYAWIGRVWDQDRRLLAGALGALSLLVLLRLPGGWLAIRPAATFAALLLTTFASTRVQRPALNSGS